MEDLRLYYEYHVKSSAIRDIDPANDTLRYISDRFELSVEQRYWLAFLYACTYSPTTTYYIYNEFPDFENVDVGRLQRWWDAKRSVLIFQTDRLRVKSSNQFVDAFISYRELIGNRTQEEFFTSLVESYPDKTYENVYKAASGIYTFGRFTLFIYLEMLYVLTALPLEPTTLNLAEAESCRNGVALAFGLDDLNNHRSKRKMSKEELDLLQSKFLVIKEHIMDLDIEHTNIWNIETTLCAYKKWRLGKRYVGYYIDRAGKEIEKMSSQIREGIDWSPLWDFRRETYDHKQLREINKTRK
jgi:hypothetical protein